MVLRTTILILAIAIGAFFVLGRQKTSPREGQLVLNPYVQQDPSITTHSVEAPPTAAGTSWWVGGGILVGFVLAGAALVDRLRARRTRDDEPFVYQIPIGRPTSEDATGEAGDSPLEEVASTS